MKPDDVHEKLAELRRLDRGTVRIVRMVGREAVATHLTSRRAHPGMLNRPSLPHAVSSRWRRTAPATSKSARSRS
jgi:hypothetical protein